MFDFPPKAPLADLPTPVSVHALRVPNGDFEIAVKHDDVTSSLYGGNKVRKLEYLLADATAQGADVVLTTGATQSNHCRQTAAAARRG